MIRKSLGVALDTMPEQRQAIADGVATEETFELLAERVAVLAARAKSACAQLKAIDGQDWRALHDHVPACLTCKPKDSRKLRERVEYLAPGLVVPQDDDRRWLAWLNAPSSGPVPMALRKVTDTLNRINPALTDPNVVKAVGGVVGLLLASAIVLVSSQPVPASSTPDIAVAGAPVTSTTEPTNADPVTSGQPPASSSNAPGSSTPGTSQADPTAPGDPANPAAPQGEQGARTARYNIKPPAPSTAPCVDDTGRLDPSPPDPAPGSINIDARPLSGRHFVLTNKTGWLDARTVQTLQLAPGSYPFQVGAPVAFAFKVEQDGTISYPDELEVFLSGKGSRTLRVDGVIVTLDARRLGGAGVLISHIPPDNRDWILCKRLRMVPSKHYYVQQGSGHVVNMSFEVTRDGRLLFDPNLKYVRGNGSSTLEFLGHLVHVDARRSGGHGLLVHFVSGVAMTYTKEQTLYLLPTANHWLQVGNKVSDAHFTLQDNGSIVLKHDALTLDTEGGVTVVTVTRPLQ
ncbi:hypothetical protein [Lentzea terrae]|uniref:hypothetical protein n=1 Tax=Lentzea terrae TaxID=2200761 RepID=UPI0013001F2F|nr:hypothetical protein [Lentzea terrae]